MKHGTIRIRDSVIVVEAPPHVSIRLRRLFGGAQRYKAGVFQLAATPEHAYDLDWFAERHPMDVDPASEPRFRELIAAHEKKMAAIAAIDLEGYVPREFELALPPREYQRKDAELALQTGNLLIASDLGTGKTVSCICALTAPGVLPAVVVTMTHLVRQWERELARFAPALRVHRIRATQPYEFKDIRVEVDPTTRRRKVVRYGGMPDVLLVNYEKLHGWVETLAGKCRTLICDEAQAFRRDGTRKHKAGKAIAEAVDLRIFASVGPSTRVELFGGPFRDGWSGPVDEAWRMLAAVGRLVVDDAYEIVEVPGDVRARGWESHERGFAWKVLRKILRHRADRPMRQIHAGGVRTDMTIEHSVFVASDVSIDERRTDELRRGDVIPSDNGARWETGSERPVDIIELARHVPRAQIVVDLSGVTRAQIGLQAWEWQNCHREATYGTRVPVATYLRNRWLRVTGPVYVGRGKAAALPPELMLSSMAYILGYFLGDGWADANRVSFAVDQPRVEYIVLRLRELEFGLRPEVRRMRGQSSEVRVSHVLLARLLRAEFGGAKCHQKRIPPAWIFTWTQAARRQLLDGLIDSDGHRRRDNPSTRSYTTTSCGLAEDVRLLVRSLGAASTVTRSQVQRGGTVDGRGIVGRRLRWSVAWSAHAAAGDSSGRRGAKHRWQRWRSLINEAVVRSVSQIDNDPNSYVYDLEMDGHPSFVANGLLAHNTATPIYNYGNEIFHVMDVVAPGQLGTWKEFLDEWCGGAADAQGRATVADPAALGSYLREAGLMVRRTRKDVGREIPQLTVVRHEVECDPDSINRVADSVAELARRVLDRIGSPLDRMQAARDIDAQMRVATGIGKAGAVAEFVRLLVDSGEQVVLSGWHHDVYRLWRGNFDRPGSEIPYAMYTGAESEAQKDAARQKFIDGAARVLIISNRAGAGLDGLQHVSRTVVVGELDWSPQVIHQLVGRVHRDGQTDPVMAYIVVTDTGSDPVISDALGIKEAQSHYLLNPDASGMPEFTGASESHIRQLAESVLKRRGAIVSN